MSDDSTPAPKNLRKFLVATLRAVVTGVDATGMVAPKGLLDHAEGPAAAKVLVRKLAAWNVLWMICLPAAPGITYTAVRLVESDDKLSHGAVSVFIGVILYLFLLRPCLRLQQSLHPILGRWLAV